MADASEYLFEPIRDQEEVTLYRARRHGKASPILARCHFHGEAKNADQIESETNHIHEWLFLTSNSTVENLDG